LRSDGSFKAAAEAAAVAHAHSSSSSSRNVVIVCGGVGVVCESTNVPKVKFWSCWKKKTKKKKKKKKKGTLAAAVHGLAVQSREAVCSHRV
jgi:hypothetical protein